MKWNLEIDTETLEKSKTMICIKTGRTLTRNVVSVDNTWIVRLSDTNINVILSE